MSRSAPGCTTQVGGALRAAIDCSREETFVSNRVRHAIRFHIVSWLRQRRHVRCAQGWSAAPTRAPTPRTATPSSPRRMGSFAQHLSLRRTWSATPGRSTPTSPPAGAMRGYGMPQASFADESHVDDVRQGASAWTRWRFRMQESDAQGLSRTRFRTNVNYERLVPASVWRSGGQVHGLRPQGRRIREGYRPRSAAASAWRRSGTTPAVYPISLETLLQPHGQLNLDGTVQRADAARRRSARARTRPMPR